MEQGFTAGSPGERLLGDITYMRTGWGRLYLATVIDSGTRRGIGWQLADRMRASPVLDALEMAHLHWHQPATCPGFVTAWPSQAPCRVADRAGVVQDRAAAAGSERARLARRRASPTQRPSSLS